MKLILNAYGLFDCIYVRKQGLRLCPLRPTVSTIQSDSTQLKSSLPDTARFTLFGIEKYKYSSMGKYPGCKLYYLQKDDTLFNRKASLWLPVVDVFWR